jgi:hypothetical protein
MGVEAIWCEVLIDDVAPVLDEYELWKHDPWYESVDWLVVCAALAGVLQVRAENGVVMDLLGELQQVEGELSDLNRQGLVALVLEPITVTQVQLTSGGHRLAAMRRQGVRAVPGMFHRDDLGESIQPERVYPTTPSTRLHDRKTPTAVRRRQLLPGPSTQGATS